MIFVSIILNSCHKKQKKTIATNIKYPYICNIILQVSKITKVIYNFTDKYQTAYHEI